MPLSVLMRCTCSSSRQFSPTVMGPSVASIFARGCTTVPAPIVTRPRTSVSAGRITRAWIVSLRKKTIPPHTVHWASARTNTVAVRCGGENYKPHTSIKQTHTAPFYDAWAAWVEARWDRDRVPGNEAFALRPSCRWRRVRPAIQYHRARRVRRDKSACNSTLMRVIHVHKMCV